MAIIHGDDLLVVGPESHFSNLDKSLREKLKIKIKPRIGPGEYCRTHTKTSFLNREIHYDADSDCLYYEADQKHVREILNEFRLAYSQINAENQNTIPGGIENIN